jgi:hypothetical protein
MLPLAHIVQGAGFPVALGWVSASLIALGGAGILLLRGTAMEVVSWIVFGCAFCCAASVIAVTAVLPTSARISISLAPPVSGSVSSPVRIVVCGAGADGSPVSAPDGDNVLVALVDGKEAALEQTGSFAVLVPPGQHRLRVELLTREHRVFSPEVTADALISVTGVHPLAAAAVLCPRR